MEPFGRATLDTASAYFKIKNNANKHDDALIKASAPSPTWSRCTSGDRKGRRDHDAARRQDRRPRRRPRPSSSPAACTSCSSSHQASNRAIVHLTLEFESGLTMDVEITVES